MKDKFSYLVVYRFWTNDGKELYGNIRITSKKKLTYKDLGKIREIIYNKCEIKPPIVNEIIILNIIRLGKDK